jgi:hypothetical protein
VVNTRELQELKVHVPMFRGCFERKSERIVRREKSRAGKWERRTYRIELSDRVPNEVPSTPSHEDSSLLH